MQQRAVAVNPIRERPICQACLLKHFAALHAGLIERSTGYDFYFYALSLDLLTPLGEKREPCAYFFEYFQSAEILYQMPLVLPLISTGTALEMLNKLSVLIFSIATVNNCIYTKWMSRRVKALDLALNQRQTGDQIAVMLRLLHKVPGVQLWFDINLLSDMP